MTPSQKIVQLVFQVTCEEGTSLLFAAWNKDVVNEKLETLGIEQQTSDSGIFIVPHEVPAVTPETTELHFLFTVIQARNGIDQLQIVESSADKEDIERYLARHPTPTAFTLNGNGLMSVHGVVPYYAVTVDLIE